MTLLRSSLVRGSSVLVAIAIAATTPGSASASAAEPPASPPAVAATAEPSPASEPAPAEYERLIAQGDQLVSEGKPSEGAQQLASAYQQMPEELRISDVGRFLVVEASNAYEAAWQATADPTHLEANQVLLAAYFADLEAARAAGKPTVPANEHENALRARSAAIEAMTAPPADAPPPPPPVANPTTIESQVEITFPPPDPRRRRNALILVGVGAGGSLLGGIMVIAGAVTASRAEDQRDTLPAEEAAGARSDKLAGSVVATVGALVFSGSVMMLGTGGSRLGELRREVALNLQPTIGGMVLRGRF